MCENEHQTLADKIREEIAKGDEEFKKNRQVRSLIQKLRYDLKKNCAPPPSYSEIFNEKDSEP